MMMVMMMVVTNILSRAFYVPGTVLGLFTGPLHVVTHVS